MASDESVQGLRLLGMRIDAHISEAKAVRGVLKAHMKDLVKGCTLLLTNCQPHQINHSVRHGLMIGLELACILPAKLRWFLSRQLDEVLQDLTTSLHCPRA